MNYAIAMAMILLLIAGPGQAERAVYGEIELTGLARENWGVNPPREVIAMVCNIQQTDGSLAVRDGPDTRSPVVAELNRLAVAIVDTQHRRGSWVRLVNAYRRYTVQGESQDYFDLNVAGWVNDGFLCDFLD